jgi:hypothetical protein
MATFFYKVTLENSVGVESVQNVLYYSENEIGITVPTPAMMTTVAERVRDQVLPAMLVPMDTQMIANAIRVVGFASDGSPSTELPVILTVSGAGSHNDARDGNGLCAIVTAEVGTVVSLASGSGLVRRPYWAVGPLVSPWVDDDGGFTGLANAEWTALAAALAAPLTVLTVPDQLPIKVSHRASGVTVPAITSYRPVTGAHIRAQTSMRRSRLNQR